MAEQAANGIAIDTAAGNADASSLLLAELRLVREQTRGRQVHPVVGPKFRSVHAEGGAENATSIDGLPFTDAAGNRLG